jgi:hypothetical protein
MKPMLLIISLVTLLGVSTASFGQSNKNVTTTYPRVVAKVSLAHKTTTVPATRILKPTTDGFYRISAYLVQSFSTSSSCTNPPCGTVSLSFQWTDDGGTHAVSTASQNPNFITPFVITFTDCASSPFNPPACVPAYTAFAGPGGDMPVSAFPASIKAGKPLTYSVTGNIGSGMSYDLVVTVEKLM